MAAWLPVVALLILGVATRLAHGFEWDELQLLHGAWRIARGDIPYRDFFEHHPPLLHLLLAPVVRSETDISWRLLVEVRIAAAIVVTGILLALARLLRRSAGAQAAAWVPAAMLVLCPVSGKLFELRADWFALLALLGAMLFLTGGPDRRGAFLAGMLAGLATGFTQKAVPLGLGMATWVALSSRIRSSGEAAARAPLLPFLAGALVPMCALMGAFAGLGALGPLVDSVVTINLAWPRETGFEASWYPSAVAALGAVALALRSIAGVGQDLVRGGPIGRERSLVALVGCFGIATYVASPIPWEQSFVLLVVPWVAWLAIDAVAGHAMTPGHFPGDLPPLAAALVVAAVTLPPLLGLRAIVAAVVAGAAIAVAFRGDEARRLRRAVVVLLLPGTVLFVVDRINDVAEARGDAQMHFARTVSARVPRTAVLTLWDHVLPFRPTPVFHWFAHEGVLRRFEGARGTVSLDREFADAVDRGRASLVIADEALVEEYLPAFAAALRGRCRLVANGYASSDAYGCETSTAVRRAAPPAAAPNIVLVVIDTLRADHVSCYGYPRATTPTIDALAANGVAFTQAISQAPWTAASVGSLVTGVYPSVHGIDGGIEWSGNSSSARLPFITQRTLRRGVRTLPERLHASGYRTAGFVSNVYLNAVFGFGRGFDLYVDDHADYSGDVMTLKRRGEDTNRRVMQWLDTGLTEPFFLLVHYNDPHWPYDPPAPFGAAWTAGYAGTLTPADTALIVESEGRPVRDLGPDDLAYLEALYDGEIAYADASLRALLDRLHAAGLERPMLTVVTADHGEEFLDHGSTSHGYTLYDEQIHVPLVVDLPGRLPPSRVPEQVRLIDVAPTILDLAGVPSRRGMQGRSLVPLVNRNGEQSARNGRNAFSEAPLRGVMRSIRTPAGLKLIQDAGRDRFHLYDLRHDPLERDDRSGRDARVESEMKRRLAHRLAANASRGDRLRVEDPTSGVLVDGALKRRLEALGYIAGSQR